MNDSANLAQINPAVQTVAVQAPAADTGLATAQVIAMDPALADKIKLVEDVIVHAVGLAKTLPSPHTGDVVTRAIQRVQAGDIVSFADVSEFFAAAMKALDDSGADNTGVEETVMTRRNGVLVEAVVEGDTLFTTVPAGTPIVKDQGESYEDSLEWLEAEGLVESVGKGGKGGLRLTAAVQFVTPASAMAMIAGSANAWTNQDERKFDPDKYKARTKRNFTYTGVKVRRA